MRKLGACLVLLAVTTVSSGCASLNSVQRAEYQSMKATGVAIEEKQPVLGAALGILPGGGSFYTRQWGLGVADLLLWPMSIAWDPIAGYQGSEAINYDVSRAHAKQVKQREMRDLEQQLESNSITQVEFNSKRRAIDERFDF